MKKILSLIAEFLLIFALYDIIRMVWIMVEVKLYGYSQASAVDSFMTLCTAVFFQEELTYWMRR